MTVQGAFNLRKALVSKSVGFPLYSRKNLNLSLSSMDIQQALGSGVKFKFLAIELSTSSLLVITSLFIVACIMVIASFKPMSKKKKCIFRACWIYMDDKDKF